MIQSNKFGLTAVVLSMVLAGCSSAPTDESTDIEDTSVQTGQVDTSAIDDSAMDAATAADTVFYFDYDKALLKPESRAALLEHAASLNSSPRSVRLEGHADERGTPEYNIALGERRAKSVVTYLETMGVSQSQLSVVSYGEEKPMIKDRSEDAFAKNRRAVLVY